LIGGIAGKKRNGATYDRILGRKKLWQERGDDWKRRGGRELE